MTWTVHLVTTCAVLHCACSVQRVPVQSDHSKNTLEIVLSKCLEQGMHNSQVFFQYHIVHYKISWGNRLSNNLSWEGLTHRLMQVPMDYPVTWPQSRDYDQ